MKTKTDTPRIYVACLASYNAGTMHGEWIDATDADTIREKIQDMLSKSPEPGAEEWAIHDSDNFGGLSISEWEDLDKVAELGALVEEHGAAFALFADNVGVNHATADSFLNVYYGEYESEQDYAEALFDNLHDVPETVRNYIDYKAFAHDFFMDGHYSLAAPNCKVHVFQNI